MTDAGQRQEAGIASFYDCLAPDYDVMTDFEGRFAREKPFFRVLVERHGIRTALDAGCGTGFHSILLSQLGVAVTAVDIAPGMIAKLRENASALGLEIRAITSGLGELPVKAIEPVDAIFCTGNTLAHLHSAAERERVLRRFHELLHPGGVLFLQLLNYERILSLRERIQSVREKQGVTFIRFYDFEDDRLRFNILRLEKRGQEIRPHLSSVELKPLLLREVEEDLEKTGFTRRKAFGDIAMREFDPVASRDLVILAVREGSQTPP